MVCILCAFVYVLVCVYVCVCAHICVYVHTLAVHSQVPTLLSSVVLGS